MQATPAVVPLLLLASLAASARAQDWVHRTNNSQPPGATLPSMAYDLARSRCVMFGGWNAPLGTIVFRDTWEWDGSNWQQRATPVAPPERDDHGMAFDLARNRTVLWGGEDFNFALITATWEWDGSTWVDRQPANAPPGRLGSPLCYDIVRGKVVLFGGTTHLVDFNDTWEWDGSNWAQVTTAAAPSPRGHHGLAYDSSRARVVLFGGEDAFAMFDETWLYDGTNWVPAATAGAPPARTNHAMVFDWQRTVVVLFGGADQLSERNDTWEWDGRLWHEVTTAARPPSNSTMAHAFDVARNQVVIAGGFDGLAAIADTFEYGGQTALYRTFGRGCPGSNGLVPRLLPRALPQLGGSIRLDVQDLPLRSGFLFLVTGSSRRSWNGQPLPVDLTALGLPGCTGYTSADVPLLIAHSNGTAAFTYPIPSNPALSGMLLYHQALSIDPAVARPLGAAVSNAGEATLR